MKNICPTVINKFALLYSFVCDKTVIIPEVIWIKMNSKLFGTKNPTSKTVSKWVYNPNLESKKALIINGSIHMGTANT